MCEMTIQIYEFLEYIQDWKCVLYFIWIERKSVITKVLKLINLNKINKDL